MGNELADQTAKNATVNRNLPEFRLSLSASSIKKDMIEHLLSQWPQRWDTSVTGRRTYQYLPKVTKNMLSSSSAITKYISGHGPFPTYFARFGLLESELCECGLRGTPDHYVFACINTRTLHLPKPSEDGNWKQ
ncbi:Retrovirus-related Pol polyprotein from type-1 retrotransposable element R1, partial [Stegodyphus mimosarum]